ncbi:MAG: translocation/assembly module TamB domain-containing protein [Pseudomonadota bacterium]
MKKILKWLVLIIAGLLLLMLIAWWWLFNTRAGAAWVLGQVQHRVDTLAWSSLNGNLSDGLELEQLRFAQAGLVLDVEQLTLAVSVRPMPPLKVSVRQLHLDRAVIQLPPAQPQASAAEPIQLSDFSSPLMIEVMDVAIHDLAIQPADVAPIDIQSLTLSGRYYTALEIDRLALQSQPFTLDVSGAQSLAAPWVSDWSAMLDWQVNETLVQQLSVEASGPISDLQLMLDAQGPLSKTGQLSLVGLPNTHALRLALDVDGQFSHWPGLDAAVEHLEVDVSGGLDEWQTTVRLTGRWQDYPAARVELQASGNMEQVAIEPMQIQVLDGQIEVLADLSWTDQLSASGQIQMSDLNVTTLYPDWPNQARLDGGLSVQFQDRRLTVDSINLQAPPSALQLDGEAQFDLASERLSMMMNWSSLTWPPVLAPADSEPLLSSESGQFKASGTLQEWRAELDALLALPGQPELPQAHIQFNASGDDQQVQQFAAELNAPESGQATVTGRAGFDGTLDANVVLERVDPAMLVKTWPGQIDADLSLQVNQLEPLAANLVIEQLQGQLRNLAVSGSGGARIDQQQLGEADLSIGLGQNQLNLNSGDGSTWGLSIQAPRLNQLLPTLSGDFQLDGTIQTDTAQARWLASSDRIGLGDVRARSLVSEGQLSWAEQPSVELQFDAADVDLNPWERLDQISLDLAGTCQSHDFRADVIGQRMAVQVLLNGALPGCLDKPANWLGQLMQLELTETEWGDWRLADPVDLAVDQQQLSLHDVCLVSQDQPSELCVYNLQAGSSGQAELALNALPLDVLLLPANPAFRISSLLDGRLHLVWDKLALQSMDGQFQVGHGNVQGVGAERELLSIEGISLIVDSPTSGTTKASLQAQLEGDTRFDAELSIPDWSDVASMQLHADMQLNLPDLSVFNRLIPQLDELNGRVEGELNVSGPIGQPEITGRMTLHDGLLFHSPLGSRIEQINLELIANESDATIQGGFAAGAGSGQLTGELVESPTGWSGQLTVHGQQLQVTDIDWNTMTISPDLSIGLSQELLEINGELVVDRARLGMPPGLTQRVEPSSDVVIVNGTESDDSLSAANQALRMIDGTVRLDLGDDMLFDAAGMETRLAGALTIDWIPGEAMPTGLGEIELIDGAYRAYGQNLEVDPGRIIFTGQPIDNPRLDISAIREIFGDSQVDEAGVSITGNARDPEVSVFTSPLTSREKAIAYLLTGADFDHASGQGAFNVGLYVLPSVFISYGVGLFDTGNVLAARWNFSDIWGLRATSGESDTGADLSLLIER